MEHLFRQKLARNHQVLPGEGPVILDEKGIDLSSSVQPAIHAGLSPELPAPQSWALLIFQLSDRIAAVRLEDVEKITLMAELADPPGLPSVLQGVLNLAGVAIPVLRLDRLFELPPQQFGLYSGLVILKTTREGKIALPVDRVTEVLSVPESGLLPLDPADSLNGCAEATVTVRGAIVYLLSPNRILLAKEREALAEFQAIAQQRLLNWEPA